MQRFILLIGLWLCLSVSVYAADKTIKVPQYATEILNKVYNGFHNQRDCWKNTIDEGRYYCLKPSFMQTLKADTGQRLYLVLSGKVATAEHDDFGSHADIGQVGFFIFENQKLIASESEAALGSWGSAPTDWKLVKLAPSDYYGWQGSWGDCHFGQCGSFSVMYAPFGKEIKDLLGWITDFSNSGNCEDNLCPVTDLISEVLVDNRSATAKVYPLRISLSGTKDNKPFPKRSWFVPFDTQSWSYPEPDQWILKGMEF